MKKTIYILLALVMLFGGIQVKAAEEEIDPATILKSFNELYSYILYYYVDEPDIVDLLRGAMQGMVETLDVHSTYLSEEEFEDLQMEFEGHFGGIGIVILPDLTVVSPIKGTPGERVGIQPGDVIIAIDGESTEDMSQTEAVQKCEVNQELLSE